MVCLLLFIYVPIYYRNLSNKHVIISTIISWLSGSLFVLCAFLSSTDDLVPVCFPPTAFQKTSLDLWNNSGIALNIVIVGVYLSVIFLARKSLLKSDTTTTPQEKLFEKKRLHIIKTLIVVVVVFVLTWALTTVIIRIFIAVQASAVILFHGVSYVGGLCLANVSLNFFIYSYRMAEFRQTISKLFCRKSDNHVGSANVIVVTTQTK